LEKYWRKGVYGTISDENRAINASGLVYNAPENVWEYSEVGNIFKVFHRFFHGEELFKHTIHRFAIKGSFGFLGTFQLFRYNLFCF
jgi:hypothetical protein